ncbi:hypothetical protein C923_00166 [Plasmodium falciparum UGT5.1]|uniref:Uncharacterized protein n=1 Tax=Plasmodium falciparum UGT5.1 TaxID=1237627 RepID=W7K543_PLAFA|nr:hypothetical protein C923_00166 [Plasmodium falciparum UGT5.1]
MFNFNILDKTLTNYIIINFLIHNVQYKVVLLFILFISPSNKIKGYIIISRNLKQYININNVFFIVSFT